MTILTVPQVREVWYMFAIYSKHLLNSQVYREEKKHAISYLQASRPHFLLLYSYCRITRHYPAYVKFQQSLLYCMVKIQVGGKITRLFNAQWAVKTCYKLYAEEFSLFLQRILWLVFLCPLVIKSHNNHFFSPVKMLYHTSEDKSRFRRQ